MGFIFVHEYTENQGLDKKNDYEGATLSLGRRVKDKGNQRYRDRIDIIVESPVINGISQGLQRTRIYIDPYCKQNKEPLWQGELDSTHKPPLTQLFNSLSDTSWSWANDTQHIWDHWTSAYIDYFGNRQKPISKSYFFVEQSPASRIEIKLQSK
jgi:hypothetical protein